MTALGLIAPALADAQVLPPSKDFASPVVESATKTLIKLAPAPVGVKQAPAPAGVKQASSPVGVKFAPVTVKGEP